MSVYLHVGQCGNQLGDAFWRLTEENRSILPTTNQRQSSIARRIRQVPLLLSKQFYHQQSHRARCILVDTEPKVIHSIVHTDSLALWIPAHIHYEQSGRGNNWAMGYNLQTYRRNVVRPRNTTLNHSMHIQKGRNAMISPNEPDKRELVERVMESLQKEIEALDCFQGIVLMHSLGGGTGAGLGCRLLESIRDTYERIYITTISIAPSCACGDTPLQNYNALFTLSHLQQYADCIIYKENDELLRTVSYWKTIRDQGHGAASPHQEIAEKVNGSGRKVTMSEINSLAAADIAGVLFPTTNPYAFGNRGPSQVARPLDMGKLVHDCCPMPAAKFVDVRTGILRDKPRIKDPTAKTVGCQNRCDPIFHAPVTSLPGSIDKQERETDASMQLRLTRYTINSFPRTTTTTPSLAVSAILRDEQGPTPLTLSQLDTKLPRVHWNQGAAPTIVHTANSMPFSQYGATASMSLCINNGHVLSSTKHFIERGQRQFRAKAYTHWYRQYGLEDSDFDQAFEQCTRIVQEYETLLQ